MTAREKLMAALIALHNPEAINVPGHVIEVWEDGEITMTKSGNLYGQRNLHQMAAGLPSLEKEPLDLPVKSSVRDTVYTHSRIFTSDLERAEQLICRYVEERTGKSCAHASIAKYIDKEVV